MRKLVAPNTLAALATWALLASSLVKPAFAQDASAADIAQARQLGGQAQAAFDAGKYGESETLWTAAAGLYKKAPTLQLGLARAAAKNGHVVLAQENYNKIIRDGAASPPTSQAFKDAIESAKAEVVAVSSRIASVTLAVEGPTSPIVTVDGASVPSAAFGLKRPVDPGAHKVHAESPGYNPADLTFTVAEGGHADAKLKLEKSTDGVLPASAGKVTSEPTPTPPKSGAPNRTFAYVAFGVGGAALLVGAVTGILAIGKHGDLKDACPDATCPSTKQSDVDSYKTMGTISTVGFVVGGVGVAAGAILLLTAPKQESALARYTTVRVAGMTLKPYVAPTAAGLIGSF